MLAMTSIATGSSGNSTLIHTPDDAVLIDCGVSFKRLKEKFASINYDIDKLRAIFITHEHSDHISGLRVTANALEIPIFCNMETSIALKHKKHYPDRVQIFINASDIIIGKFSVHPFSIPHDGANTVAYTICLGNKKVAVATDFGFATQSVINNLQDCDAFLLESNHDVDKLLACEKRPWKLKQRILSKHGHLSNESCQEILKAVISPRLKNIILGHISNDANEFTLVKDLTLNTLKNLKREDIGLQVMPQGVVGQTIIV